MKKLQIIREAGGGYLFRSRGKNPCSCIISDIKFDDLRPVVSCDITWVEKGRYTNIQRKKMLSRTFNTLLRKIVHGIKASARDEKIS